MSAAPVTTAEVRWWRRGAVPPGVRAWFDALGEAPAPEARTDHYLAPTDDALGVKWRGGDAPAAEPKRREAIGDVLRAGRAEAPAETWAKWSLPLDAGDAPVGWIAVHKTRRQHRLGTDDDGVALELAEVDLGGGAWWSVALEATAEAPEARLRWLREGAARWLARDDAPALDEASAMGYPAWLRAHAG